MPTADQHPSSEFSRLLVMGPSGSGKTGSLLSLLLADYKVGVIDMDNGLDWLVAALRKQAPDKLKNLSFQTFRDKFKMTAGGPVYDSIPNAYTKAIQALDKWDDGSRPSEWGHDRILVLDSLTFFGNAAYNWKDALNPTVKDKRQIYGAAQDAVADILDAITSPAFRANVIVFTHIRWNYFVDAEGNRTIVGGGPSSIGEALTDKIGTFFNNVGLFEKTGSGVNTKRKLTFLPTALIDLKAAAINLPTEPQPVETALATFFKAARAV